MLTPGEGSVGRASLAERFGELLESCIAPFAVQLLVARGSEPTSADILSGGTGALVATGRGEFLVTNHHVYAYFLDAREEYGDAVLLMSGANGFRYLDISPAQVAGLARDVDLAVLRMPVKYVFGQGKMLMPHTPWPPRRPTPGMAAIVYGYPGQGCVPEGPTQIGVSAVRLLLPVQSVSERHFVLVDENGDTLKQAPPGREPLTCFGGVSGSAVYAIDPPDTGAERKVSLAGFIYEASDSGVFFATHADHVQADGSIH